MLNNSIKVIVGMSGGVDSSVAAYLLKSQGYQVEGLFMKNWEEDDRDNYCAAAKDAADAKAVADQIGIKFHTVNFSQQYWDKVFEYFLHEYQAGRTPNPDIMCNKEIKFKAFLHYARNYLNADFIATGHYARRSELNNEIILLKAHDANKDQTYFLYQLDQQQLRQVLFPIGELPKAEVRTIARIKGFITHNKKDSTGICFIGKRKFKNFLQTYLPAKPGNLETLDNEVMGRHDGLMYYTLGQRQGLHIGGIKAGNNMPWFVIGKDLKRNVLIVAQGKNHPALFKAQLDCAQIYWISGKQPTLPLACTAKTRYRQTEAVCTISKIENNHYQVVFNEAQRAITPGQSVVFFQNEICLGGGIII